MSSKMMSSILCGLLSFLFQACHPDRPPNDKPFQYIRGKNNAFFIGVVLPSSDALIVKDYLNGITMALIEINSNGGVNGHPVNLVFKDDKGQLSEALKVARAYTKNPDIVAVIGHSKSNISIAVSTIYQHHGILMISPFSTNPELTDKNFNLIFRNIPSDIEFARDLARFAKNKKYRRIMIAYANNMYGLGLADEFEAYGQHLGIEVIDRKPFNFTGDVDFSSELNQWKLHRSDAVFIAGSDPQGTQIIRQMRDAGMNTPVFASEDLDSPDFIHNGGAAVEGTVIAVPFNPHNTRPETVHFVKTFKTKYHYVPGAFAAQGYDTLNVLTYAMNKVHSVIPAEVSASLHRLRYWPGVCGPVTFTRNGAVINKPIAKKMVKNGQFTFLNDQQ